MSTTADEHKCTTIKREDIDRRIVVISDVVSGHRLPPVHSGEMLWDEFLIPGISVYALAHAIKGAPLSGE